MYYLGIDLGGTNIAAGIVNENYEIIAKAEMPTGLPLPDDMLCDRLYQTGMSALKKAGIEPDQIEWVGVGSPGTVSRSEGTVFVTVNRFSLCGLNLRDQLQRRFNKPCFVENDANAAAYGEALAGATAGTENSVMVTLGTGVGSGIIIDRKIYNGFNFAGAEVGHTVIMKDGRLCSCGRRGCWEMYASVSALIYQTKLAMVEAPQSLMWKLVEGDISRVNGRIPFDAMREGDGAAAEVVKNYIEYIGCGVVDIINTFQPDMICIGGGISKEGDTLLIPLRQYIVRERYSKYTNKQTSVCAAKLGNGAGLIGAAMLGIML